MQSVVMHVIMLCGGFYLPVVLSPAPARVKTGSLWAPVCVCVCSVGEHAFLKLNPELTAVLFLSCWLAKDTGDYQGRGTKIQWRMREEKNGSMMVLKEGLLLNTLMGVRRKGHACWKPCGKTFGQRLETGAKTMQWLTSKGRTFEFTVPELYPLDLLYNATNYVDVNPVVTSTSSYSEWY